MAKRKLASDLLSLLEPYVSSENGTSTAAASFLGQYVRCVNYSRICTSVKAADEDGILTIYQSIDGSADTLTSDFNTTADVSFYKEYLIFAPYVKIGWVSSGGTPGSLNIFTKLTHDGGTAGAVQAPLTAGPYISITGPPETPTINNTSPLANINSAGGTSLIKTAASGTLKGLTAGTGVTLTSNTNDVQVTNSAPDQTLTSAGGTSIIKAYPVMKGLTAGTGISLTSNTNDVQVTNTSPDQTVVMTAGTGITISPNTYPNFTVTNASPDQTLTSAGGTSIIKAYPVLKGLTAGTGITLTSNTDDVQVTNSSPGSAITLTGGVGITVSGSYPSWTFSVP